MKKIKHFARKYNVFLTVALSVFIIFLVFCIWKVLYLRRMHSTFENYYKFRGCRELIEKNDVSAVCRLSDDKLIKIVKYKDRWFLDGDLPGSFPSI